MPRDDSDPNPNRRRVLQLSGGALLAGLGGVGGGSSGGGSSDDGSGDSMDGSEDGSVETTTEGSMEGGANSSMEGSEGSMEDSEGSMEGTESGGMSDTSATTAVRIENVAATDVYGADTPTGGAVWITPGAFAVHAGANPIYTEGQPASVGLEALAEAGPPTGFEGRPGLVEELSNTTDGDVVAAGAYGPGTTVADPNDPKGAVPGAPPIAPGGAFEFAVESAPGRRLSSASMFVPSNDLFFAPGPEDIPLWDGDAPVAGDVTGAVDLWDAGTEPDTAPGRGPDQAPAQDSPDQGADEGGVVRRLADVDDGYSYPAVADTIRVTLTPQ